MRHKIIFSKINSLLRFALKNKHSRFYQKKFLTSGLRIKGLVVKDWNQFRQLPFLTKKELRETPAEKRLFLPPPEVTAIKYSSGTSGRPSFSYYRLHPSDRVAYRKIRQEVQLTKKVKRILILTVSKDAVENYWEFYGRKLKKLVALGDVKDMRMCALLATEMKPDMVIGSPKRVLELVKLLRIGERKNIIFFVRTGDKISILQKRLLKSHLPHARIFRTYSPSDATAVAVDCPYLFESVNLYHVTPSVVVEVIDPVTGENLKTGEVGELVVTKLGDLRPAFPIIRYKTGDLGSWEDTLMCRCGRRLIRIFGRASSTIATLGPFTYFRESLEKILLPFYKYLTGNLILEIIPVRNKFSLQIYLEVPQRPLHSVQRRIIHAVSSHPLFYEGEPKHCCALRARFSANDLKRAGIIKNHVTHFVRFLDYESKKWRDIVDRRTDYNPITFKE